MFMNKMGNGANLSNTVDIVANSIKLIRRINGVDVLLDITDALERRAWGDWTTRHTGDTGHTRNKRK